MFSFGLANFLSVSDRMSDMLKKFSTSLMKWSEYNGEFWLAKNYKIQLMEERTEGVGFITGIFVT